MNKILLYNSGGGLGDAIQLFPVLLSLTNHYKKSKFYYLGAHNNHFRDKLKEFNFKIDTIDLDLKYFGFRWWHLFFVKKKYRKKNLQKFDLIIDLQTKFRNTIILKQIPHNKFYSKTFNSFFSTGKITLNSNNHIENLSFFLKENITPIEFKLNYLPKKLLDEAKKLLPNKNYIGFSITQGNKYRKKNWSLNNFINLANKIKSKNKTPVFLIEKDKTKLIEKIKNQVPGAIFPEEKSDFDCPALVTALASRLEKGITIDNGIMHMMSLAKIPMVVLFGPTNSKKFAPTHKFVKILDSKDLHNTKDIDSISVEEVFTLI